MFRIIKKSIYRLINILIYRLSSDFDLDNNQVIFESLPDYSDNARALSDYLVENKKNVKIVWLVDDPKQFENTESRILFLSKKTSFNEIPHNTLRTVLKSRYIMATHGFTVKKECFGKKNQIYVRLWHGCGYKANERKIKEYKDFDYTLVPGKIFVNSKSQFWGVSEDHVLALGLPRYDWLKNDDSLPTIANKLLNGDTYKKRIIWMPTFRNAKTGNYPENSISDFPLFHSQSDWNLIDQICGELKIQIVLKLHPFQKEYSALDFSLLKNIIEINDDMLKNSGINLYQLLTCTDALISDYSSVTVDYLLLDKPIAYVLDDYDLYKQIRGFVFEEPLKYMPGNHVYSKDDFISFISNVAAGKDVYKEQRHELLPIMQTESTNYSKDVWDKLRELAGDK